MKIDANSSITYTCKIYEVLPDKEAKNMSLKYAELKHKLEKIDKTRALYAYYDQIIVPFFWQMYSIMNYLDNLR
jgi:hypothetical protein